MDVAGQLAEISTDAINELAITGYTLTQREFGWDFVITGHSFGGSIIGVDVKLEVRVDSGQKRCVAASKRHSALGAPKRRRWW